MTTPNEPMDPRTELRRQISDLLVSGFEGADAAQRYLALCVGLEEIALPLRRALLCTPLAWTEDERRDAAWLQRCSDDLAVVGYRLALASAKRLGAGEATARDVTATALFYMGETVKWDVSVAPGAAHDLRKAHALLVLARERDRNRDTVSMMVEGRARECTIESLYFRALLLARFSGGALNPKQMEILDAWMWLWMPALSGVETPPAGTPLRADLDSAGGLQLGPRGDEGPSLYLPLEPIEAAYREVVLQFHAGSIVPAEGIASEFRIEEHVAVLALLRRNLRHGRREAAPRAERRVVGRPVELFVGLAEIMKRGFLPAAPEAPAELAPAEVRPDREMRIERDFDTAVDGLYDVDARMVRLVDESETGLGLEGSTKDLAGVAAGELVAVRMAPGERLVFGKVVRSVGARTAGQTLIGVRRLDGNARLVEVERESTSAAGRRDPFLFVAGTDSSGRQDAMLVAEREFIERDPLVVTVGERAYRLRLNRPRERGRGWVLAGFEVVSARPAWEVEIA